MKIRLKSVKNIRDFSEYGFSQYIRSAYLTKLSPQDADILTNRYNLKTVIDLRTSQEIEEKPDVMIPGVSYIHIPIFDNAVPGISHEEETDELRSMIPDMAVMYYLVATDDECVRQINKVMEIIFDKDREGAILWHCTEGKDRCGIISALFLLTNGISPKNVMKDYLQTNRINRAKAMKYFFLAWMSGKDIKLALKVKDAFLAKREYMEPIMKILGQLSEKWENVKNGNYE